MISPHTDIRISSGPQSEVKIHALKLMANISRRYRQRTGISREIDGAENIAQHVKLTKSIKKC
jgi:hypothetical protein